MVRGTVRHLFQLLGAVVVGLLIAVPVFVWRLSAGPMALDFLTPTIEAALTAADGSVAVKLDGTVLALSGHTVELRAMGVRVFAATQPVVSVPQIALTISGRALMSGLVAPGSIRVYGLKVHLIRDPETGLIWGLGGAADTAVAAAPGDFMRSMIDDLVGLPDPSKPGRSLSRAALVGAEVVIEDHVRGMIWHAPSVDAEIRRTNSGLEAALQAALDLGGETGTVHGKLAYRREDDGVEGEASVGGVRPARLAGLAPALGALAALDFPFSGTVRGRGTLAEGVTGIDFDLSGGEGHLKIDQPFRMDHKVAAAALRGRLSGNGKSLRIDEAMLDFGGPKLAATVAVDGLGGEVALTLDATAHGITFDDLPSLWPEGLAPNPRAWVVRNMSKGIAREARITFVGHSKTGKLEDIDIDRLNGGIEAEGVTVDYLHPMPPVENATGSVVFDDKVFRIRASGGTLWGLKITDGTIDLGGLDKPDQWAAIDLGINGPLRDALTLIDSPPLGYSKALGLRPDTVSGTAAARLQLKFPLLMALTLDEVGVHAHAVAKDAAFPDMLMGLDVSQGALTLDVDAKGMDVGGAIRLGTIAGDIQWRENFNRNAPFRSRYRLTAPKIDEAQRRQLRLDGPPFVAPWLTGPVAASVTATVTAKSQADIQVQADLTPAKLALTWVNGKKPEGVAGTAEAEIRVENGQLSAIPHFGMAIGEQRVAGSALFGPDGKARRVDFQKLAVGRTDAEGSIVFRPAGGMDIAFKGNAFDAGAMMASDSPAPSKPDLTPLALSAAFKTLYLSNDGRLDTVQLAMQRDNGVWRTFSLKGLLGEGKSLNAALLPAGPTRRVLKVTSDDAGATLRAFGIYDHVVGGKLDIDGGADDTQANAPIDGVMRISDYHVVGAPGLARLLNVASLTGIVDALRGEGIAFSTLDAPFSYQSGELKVKGGRAFGSALGLTASGRIDLDRGRVALDGTVVPMYAINSALGNIPLLGWIVTGGEKGGGLVAFNFTMRGPSDNPDVMVNPLSALTPGFLRQMFSLFSDGEARGAQP